MKTIIVGFIASLCITGCATAKTKIDSLEQKINELEQQLADKESVTVPTGTDRIDDKDVAPVPTVRATVPTAVSTLTERNTGAFQCFLDRDPGVGGGSWVRVDNNYVNYNMPSHSRWVSMTIDSQPVVVVGPVGPMWMPVMARPDVSVLPPGRSCFIPMPERRKPNGDLRSYTLTAKAYSAATNSFGRRTILNEQPDGFFPHDRDTRMKSTFALSQGLSTMTLEYYHFN